MSQYRDAFPRVTKKIKRPKLTFIIPATNVNGSPIMGTHANNDS